MREREIERERERRREREYLFRYRSIELKILPWNLALYFLKCFKEGPRLQKKSIFPFTPPPELFF